jgi:hypothetical protein
MFLYSKWLSLPLSKRIELANKLGVAKVRSTHVANDVIVDDGYVISDIEGALTVEAMQALTGSKSTDVLVLWELLIAEPAVEVVAETPAAPEVTQEEKKEAKIEVIKKVTPKKNGTKTGSKK